MEILAPAGNPEALERAWAAGADAVYLGYSAFSARAGAGNFNTEELREAIRFAHLRHMRVYVTVNTLAKDRELEGIRELLALLRALRADGILVQDLGVLRMARRLFPDLRIHASTQMALHNAAGVRWAGRMGMTRVVLARECSLEEIRLCTLEGPEIEVFGHGAQCVAVSGLCLFSSMVGGRSGNRGRCAQPCRMTYRLDGAGSGAWLSPRDVCLRDDVPALEKAGVASLKIEGRLKRPEYVAVVTDSYRRAMDALRAGHFLPAGETEKEALRQIFHRGGFMRGYAFGSEDAGVIYPEAVNHQGLEIGRVEKADGRLARVRVTRTLHNGDGLRILSGRGDGEEMIYAGTETPGGGIALVRLRPGMTAKAGDRVYRLTDAAQTEAARAMRGRTIPVEMTMHAWPGQPLALELTDGESRVRVTGENAEAAVRRESTPEELARSLSRTGGTAFEVRRVQVKGRGAFVPVSAVNALRRQGLEALEQERIAAFEAALPEGRAQPERAAGQHEKERTASGFCGERQERDAQEREAQERDAQERDAQEREAQERGAQERAARELPGVLVATAAQAEAARRAGMTPGWQPEDYREEALDALDIRKGDWFCLPEVCEEATLEALRDWIAQRRELLGGVVLGSVGQLGLSWPVAWGAGGGIPVMNREAVKLLREAGCAFATVSPELTGEELRELLRTEKEESAAGQEKPESMEIPESAEISEKTEMPKGTEAGGGEPFPLFLKVFGRVQLMLLHHCPARTALGLEKGHGACTLCDRGAKEALRGRALTDRKGYRFPLLRQRLPEGCMVRVMNALPTDLLDQPLPGGTDGALRLARQMEMTEEDGEAEQTVQRFLREEKSGIASTRGHWARPVE